MANGAWGGVASPFPSNRPAEIRRDAPEAATVPPRGTMTGRAGGGPVEPPVASTVGRGTSAVAASARSVPPVLPLLLLLLVVGGSPAAARVPQPAPRPQFLEEVRPVLPETPMEPLGPQQEVVEEIPERVSTVWLVG